MGDERSKCPVQHTTTNNNNSSSNNNNSETFWNRLWSSSSSSPEKSTAAAGVASSSSSCPVTAAGNNKATSLLLVSGGVEGCDSSRVAAVTAAAASLEEAAKHAQTPQPDQTVPLSTARQISGIPRSDTTVPHHQQGSPTEQLWVYPSEQQMYNAMRRKGWHNVPEESIPTVLQIHNHINERTWRQIQEWEGRNDLQLPRFMGRPNDLTPKAFLLSKVLGLYDPPFDRHDWYVQHPGDDGLVHRYVIDYYYLPSPDPNLPPIPYVDARPALDHPRALYLHTRRFLQQAFPGITAFLSNTNNNNNKRVEDVSHAQQQPDK